MWTLFSTYLESYSAEDGQGLVEYTLILALMVVFMIAALRVHAIDVGELLGRIGDLLDSAGT
jgi:Flp pilus assembly pilin Flp